MAEKNLLEIVRELIASGASEEEIITTLRELGLSPEDARKIIILAQKDILLTLKNELKILVKEVFEEEKEALAKKVKDELQNSLEGMRAEFKEYVDSLMKASYRSLRKDVEQLEAEVKGFGERLEIMEKEFSGLRADVADLKEEAREFKGKGLVRTIFGIALLLAGAGLLGYTFFTLPADISAHFLEILIKILIGGTLVIGGVSLLS